MEPTRKPALGLNDALAALGEILGTDVAGDGYHIFRGQKGCQPVAILTMRQVTDLLDRLAG